MGKKYKAVQITEPRKFELVERELAEPGEGQVRIRVEACGVCHSDAAAVEGGLPGVTYPRVPGHEVIGRIDAVGKGVSFWCVDQRVGVGFLAGNCGECRYCRKGDFVSCVNQQWTGTHIDGGYAEFMIAKESGLVAIPNDANAAEAAPLLCAGVTTYNALRNSGARPGDLVAVQGIGGLGHLGVQFANKMGFEVVAIARGTDKEAVAKKLGAHRYIDSKAADPAKALQEMGGAKVILSTVPDSKAMSALMAGLMPRGKLVAVGIGSEPITISPVDLILSVRSVEGSLTGSAMDVEETINFAALENITPIIETMPLAKAEEAYQRMISGKAHLRVVLTM